MQNQNQKIVIKIAITQKCLKKLKQHRKQCTGKANRLSHQRLVQWAVISLAEGLTE
jgi:hypothetical protein